jgi:two-component system LytT family response regulator
MWTRRWRFGALWVAAFSVIGLLQFGYHYLVLHAGRETYRIRATLDRLEARVDPRRFVRVSRSAMVSVDRVTELRPWSHGDWIVVLSDGSRLRLSRRYRDRLERFDL